MISRSVSGQMKTNDEIITVSCRQDDMQLTLCQAIVVSAEAPGIQYQYTYLLLLI